MAEKMTDREIEDALSGLEGWKKVEDRDAIKKHLNLPTSMRPLPS